MLRTLLDLVVPQSCVGCGRSSARLCEACLVVEPAVRMPVPSPPGLPACWSAAAYEGALRSAVLAYKERGESALAGPLADALAYTLARAVPGGSVWLVPVPSSRRASRARGHDPVGRVARLAVRRLRGLGRDVAMLPVLAQARRVTDQSGLSATQRAANLASSLRVAPGSRGAHGRPTVLVDDIVTTGATLAEGARALRAAGFAVTAAVTVAATRRRSCT
ncbi:ComF family protein [Nonomuraea sp. NPDC050536]|uniref:ComF family protein n=1 Tax=Nonomuraea sp. NPDC050536 TaxID=3364366 RepID=UPI0037C4FF4C